MIFRDAEPLSPVLQPLQAADGFHAEQCPGRQGGIYGIVSAGLAEKTLPYSLISPQSEHDRLHVHMMDGKCLAASAYREIICGRPLDIIGQRCRVPCPPEYRLLSGEPCYSQ